MTGASTQTTWSRANQRCLTAALARVKRALELHAGRPEADATADSDVAELRAAMPAPPALDSLVDVFGLSPFERDALLLCAGAELDGAFPALCAAAQGDPARSHPTFGLALAALPEAHWSALTPGAPLRSWRLLEVGSGASLVSSPLRIDERVLHYLTGVQYLDEHLHGLVRPALAPDALPPSHQAVSEALAATWTRADREAAPVQLCGASPQTLEAIASAACGSLGLRLYVMPAEALPAAAADLDALAVLWRREALLGDSALLLDCHPTDAADRASDNLIGRYLDQLGAPSLLSSRERRRPRGRTLVTFEVRKPTAAEQRALWARALGSTDAPNGRLDRVISQFDLPAPAIASACSRALASGDAATPLGADQGETLEARLWDACRVQARPQLDDLSQRIETVAGWDDLVLPEPQLENLRDLVRHVRHRHTVYEHWGFAAKSARGLGIGALFAGPSGTGKTLAAEVLAGELRLDLYRIDLSQVVSKYIGETEKNLRRVFDAAEEGGGVLLFDEADALFGKRSEVKDSHDRYANLEISYLLQRMEAYRGLAVLTTNMKSALDPAFLRRLRFVVSFPFPDARHRAEIWRRMFPDATPTEGLDPVKLAKLNVTGGNIRNIALGAAFLAADAGGAVGMSHVLAAARREYAKLEKSLTDGEIAGWT